MVIDGAHRGEEEKRLERGVNLLVATPARLLEHLRDLPAFVIKNLKAFFVYGANAETDKQIRDISTRITKSRISAVITAKADEVEGLAELICRPDAVHRYGQASSSVSTTEPQGYVIVEADKRFLLLYSFLKKFQHKKIVVLLASTPGVVFCDEAVGTLGLWSSLYSVHGRQDVKSRTTAFSDFLKDAEGTLICTEEAVQGLEVSLYPY
jgi:ATP-dependent RNA helicase DDX18/HAS1